MVRSVPACINREERGMSREVNTDGASPAPGRTFGTGGRNFRRLHNERRASVTHHAANETRNGSACAKRKLGRDGRTVAQCKRSKTGHRMDAGSMPDTRRTTMGPSMHGRGMERPVSRCNVPLLPDMNLQLRGLSSRRAQAERAVFGRCQSLYCDNPRDPRTTDPARQL